MCGSRHVAKFTQTLNQSSPIILNQSSPIIERTSLNSDPLSRRPVGARSERSTGNTAAALDKADTFQAIYKLAQRLRLPATATPEYRDNLLAQIMGCAKKGIAEVAQPSVDDHAPDLAEPVQQESPGDG